MANPCHWFGAFGNLGPLCGLITGLSLRAWATPIKSSRKFNLDQVLIWAGPTQFTRIAPLVMSLAVSIKIYA